jgi:alkaline phosphatase
MFDVVIRTLIFVVVAQLIGQPNYSSSSVFAHNDYVGEQPFVASYQQRVGYIEADIFLRDGELFVAHNRVDITASRTLEALYLTPLANEIKQNKGLAYPEADKPLTLMIDLKTDGLSTLPVLVSKLEKYPGIISCKNLYITISGSVPGAVEWSNYPAYITFDGRPTTTYTADQLQRIRLISASFKDYSTWNGRGELSPADKNKLSKVLDQAHALGKPFRFWATPDSEEAWTKLMDLKIDVINTDHPREAVAFINKSATK